MMQLVRCDNVAEPLVNGERPCHLDVITEQLGQWARADDDNITLKLVSSKRGWDDCAIVVTVITVVDQPKKLKNE